MQQWEALMAAAADIDTALAALGPAASQAPVKAEGMLSCGLPIYRREDSIQG